MLILHSWLVDCPVVMKDRYTYKTVFGSSTQKIPSLLSVFIIDWSTCCPGLFDG